MGFGVIIPAAGQGKRMKSSVKKQYLELLGLPVLVHTLSLFVNHPEIIQIIIVVQKDEIDYCTLNIVDKYFNKKDIQVVAGGKTRRESVFAGLKVFSPALDYVIIHDGARPLITNKLLNKVVSSVKKEKAVTLGSKLKDTIKKVNEKKVVLETPDRKEFMAIQTPQAFLYKTILEAHQRVPQDAVVTDDASLLEYMGYDVKIIEGSYENIKITTPIDMVVAESIISGRKRSK
ncbi:2-C-methyl-D-erythritol 4-phosphate cytidylyltransferase [Natronospora cellulosivora (SeqCode)]